MADFFKPFTEKASVIGPKAERWALVALNVREKPDTKSNKVGSISVGMSVKDLQILPNDPTWYYSESQKGYIASGDTKKEYWSATPVKAPKKSSTSAAPADAALPSAPGGPAAAAQAEPDNLPLIVGGIAIAAMLAYMLSK